MQGMERRRHGISGTFVFLLLGIFAVFSTLLVLLGAQLYRGIVDQGAQNNARRVLYSYVMNAVRGNDASGSVRLAEYDGMDMLVFCMDAGEEAYETRIYCHDGALRELFASVDSEFEPDYGEVICPAQAFEARLQGNLLEMRITDAQGESGTVHVALRCAVEKEAQAG